MYSLYYFSSSIDYDRFVYRIR